MDTPLILLAAGRHRRPPCFPPRHYASELIRRGHAGAAGRPIPRALRYSGLFTPENIDVVPSETVRGRDPLSLARTAFMLGYGTLVATNLVLAAEAFSRGRFWRLSDGAAVDGGKAARSARRHSRRQNAVLAAPTGFSPAASTRSRPRCPACSTATRHWPARPRPSARRCVPPSLPPPRCRLCHLSRTASFVCSSLAAVGRAGDERHRAISD